MLDIETKARETMDELLKEPIDINQYVKDITETKIISVEDNVRQYLKNNYKKNTTLTQLQVDHQWGEPSGIAPDRAYEWKDVLKRIEDNPGKPFNVSDVWIGTNLIYIITKFNRIPSIKRCISNLDQTYDVHNDASPIGLNWEALDRPTFYVVMYKGNPILCSTKGGHRGSKCVLSNGYGSDMPCTVTYIGTLDIEDVNDRCALMHHIDCNKRENQGAEDRLTSGVEAKDESFVNVMQDLIHCKLYADEDKMKSTAIKGFKKISSWQGFDSVRKQYGLDITKYGVDMIAKYNPNDETIITQSLETIACFKTKFDKRIHEIKSTTDIFDKFMDTYFQMNKQSDLREQGKIVKDVLSLVESFNKWCRKQDFPIKQNAITNKHLVKAFGDKLKVS
tara:strand:+ start:104 stop:1279 length:1176 start_codon:yes stop_codon:yes gene_type:complete